MRGLSNCFLFFLLMTIPAWSGVSEKTAKSTTESLYADLRNRMVEEQIVARGIKDERVIRAMKKVPRHYFIPVKNRAYAYNDEPVPIGYEQTISQPYIVALMTECLGIKGNGKVLEIGTGSGYQAAILAEIAKEVYTVEIIEPLGRLAKMRLDDIGYKNIKVKIGDGYRGWKEYAPFDCIIVTAAPSEIPQTLIEQLKVGGKMVIPVGKWFQELILVEKLDKGIKKSTIAPVRFVPMTGEVQR